MVEPAATPVTPRPRHGAAGYERRDGRIILRGETEWLVEGPPDDLTSIAEALGDLCDPLSPTLLLLDFRNAVGLFELPALGTVEVVSSKWGRAHFDAMLADLMAVASALPFSAGTAAALPYDRSVAARRDVLYHAFVYLRHALSEAVPAHERLLRALQAVVREPHARFRRVAVDVPTEAAHRLDAAGLVGMATGRGQLMPVGPGARARPPLARALRGHVPLRVGQARVEGTRDTPENRFVKAFLELALGVIDGMRREVRSGPGRDAFAARVLADGEAMGRALRPIVQDSLWADVGPMVHLPAGSTVLQRRRGYRDVFRHHVRLRLAARVPLAEGLVRDLLEAKDIAELYELWCYFALVRELQALLGPPARAGRPEVGPTAIRVPWDLEVAWGDGTRAFYNPRFSRSRPARRQSYSVPLRPDIAVEIPSGPRAGLHLFDAKFRVDRLDAIMPQAGADESEDDAVEERRGTFKRGDLYKMHAYRDAIPAARSVWILYPGSEFRFYGARGVTLTSASEPLPPDLEGVGAIPMTPAGRQAAELRMVLQRVLGPEQPHRHGEPCAC